MNKYPFVVVVRRKEGSVRPMLQQHSYEDIGDAHNAMIDIAKHKDVLGVQLFALLKEVSFNFRRTASADRRVDLVRGPTPSPGVRSLRSPVGPRHPPRHGDFGSHALQKIPKKKSKKSPRLVAHGSYAGEGTIGTPRSHGDAQAIEWVRDIAEGWATEDDLLFAAGELGRRFNPARRSPAPVSSPTSRARIIKAAVQHAKEFRDAGQGGWHTCGCGQWVHDKLAPCSVCRRAAREDRIDIDSFASFLPKRPRATLRKGKGKARVSGRRRHARNRPVHRVPTTKGRKRA